MCKYFMYKVFLKFKLNELMFKFHFCHFCLFISFVYGVCMCACMSMCPHECVYLRTCNVMCEGQRIT